MSQWQKELTTAIEKVYTAFVGYRLRPGFADRCSPLGDRPDLARRLEAQPLRSAPIEDLAIYANKATYTMGDEEDFKHFLPRMLEVYALDTTWHEYETGVWEKMRKLAWLEWPLREQAAIQDYIRTLWRFWAESLACPVETYCFIPDLLEARVDFTPLLEGWQLFSSTETYRRLAQFVLVYIKNRSSSHPYSEQIDRWFAANAVRSNLEQAFYEYAREPFAEELAEAVDLLSDRDL